MNSKNFAEVVPFPKKEIISFVYQVRSDRTALSFERIYAGTWQSMQRILDVVNDFYDPTKWKGDTKLAVRDLVAATGICDGAVRKSIVQMCAVKRILCRNSNGRYVQIRDKPMLIIQQKPMHIHSAYFGKKTPSYVFPWDERFFGVADKAD